MNCLISGEKEWIFIDTRSNYKLVPWNDNNVVGVRKGQPEYMVSVVSCRVVSSRHAFPPLFLTHIVLDCTILHCTALHCTAPPN